MRHLGTLIAAVVIAPLAWVLLAFGQDRSIQAFANGQSDGGLHTGDFVRPVLLLAAAGVLLGLLGTLRFSPLGAALTGVVYLASYLALLVSPKAVLDLFPHYLWIGDRSTDPTTPIRTGTTLLLGALLLVGVLSVGRWRRWPVAGAPAQTAPDEASAEPSTDRPLGGEGLGLTASSRDGDPDDRLVRQAAGSDTDTRYARQSERVSNSGSGWPDAAADRYNTGSRQAWASPGSDRDRYRR